MNYSDWHKQNPFNIPRIEKADKMSESEITEARALIAQYNKRHKTATQTIDALMRKFAVTQPAAARVFWTETKKSDTAATLKLGAEIGFSKYQVILSPSACKVCVKKTDNGKKIFSDKEVHKTGHGEFVPFHPNCYCICVPIS
jgi:hypothetical protein